MRNACVHEFFAVSVVSHTGIELYCVGLRLQQETFDSFEDRGFLDCGDQLLADAHASPRPTYCDALNFRHGAILFQYNAGCCDRPGVNQRKKMKGRGVVFVTLQIERHALLDYKNFFSKPEALFELALCVRAFDRYSVHTCKLSTGLLRHQKLF